jgi:hypothetical protein
LNFAGAHAQHVANRETEFGSVQGVEMKLPNSRAVQCAALLGRNLGGAVCGLSGKGSGGTGHFFT